ncbi:corepressor interacting with RBPJ 1-like [Hetaerina americana]|uniref:corepressor interacting with RBPJ 1-like n=1 Tax=Hetaerina americana TaxID=62018 RepID=UPI003A7F1068
MGKGFNNYMCKKFFHPASRDNLKRVWMAEQKADAYKKKQEELRVQYEKEQDLYNNKALLSKESKDKLSVNFMYEPPPGAKKERQKEDDEPEYKFEWQRKYNAPREDYCKDNAEIRDQPFGIQVRNVRCIKCHKWGHINTDKECPLFNQSTGVGFGVTSKASGSGKSSNESSTNVPIDAVTLVQQMREDGLALKRSAMGLQQHMEFPPSQQLVSSDTEDDKVKDSDMKFLKSLSTAQKRKLLKKLEKLEKKAKGKSKKKLKKKKKQESSDSDASSAKEKSKRIKKRSDCNKKSKHAKDQKHKESKKNKHLETASSSSSSSSTQSSESEEDIKPHKIKSENNVNHDAERYRQHKTDAYSRDFHKKISNSKMRDSSPAKDSDRVKRNEKYYYPDHIKKEHWHENSKQEESKRHPEQNYDKMKRKLSSKEDDDHKYNGKKRKR